MEGAHLSLRSGWITAAQGTEQKIMAAWEIVFFFNRFLLNLQFGIFFFFELNNDRIQQLPFSQHIRTEVKLNNSTRGEKKGKKQHQGGPLLAFESDASAK